MRFLWLSFLVLTPVLAVLLFVQKDPVPFPDGRLACPPLPLVFGPAPVSAPLATPRPLTLAQMRPPGTPAPVAAARIQIVEPQPRNEGLLALRQADRSDWGLGSMIAPPSLSALASLMPPRVVQPVPVRPTAAPEPSPPPGATPTPVAAIPAPSPTPVVIQPNLYLPEGAVSEEGAFLTLIKGELAAYEDPDAKASPAPFVMKEGDRVRPLTRLRNEKDFDWIRFERDGRQWWAQAEYFIRVDPRNRAQLGSRNLPVGQEAVDKDSALPPDYHPDDLVEVSRDFMIDPKEIRVRRETAEALERMIRAAEKQGLKLRVFSGFRDFQYQKKLYLEAIAKNGPKQNGTAAPGYSEHQLGTTIDVSNTDRRYILSGRFGDTPEGRWLYENIDKYGFRHSYTLENTEQVGYKSEPWHLRYVGTALTQPPDKAIARR